MKTRIAQVAFEVPEDYTDEQLHETLCRCVHEGCSYAQEELMNTVSDIAMITDTQPGE